MHNVCNIGTEAGKAHVRKTASAGENVRKRETAEREGASASKCEIQAERGRVRKCVHARMWLSESLRPHAS